MDSTEASEERPVYAAVPQTGSPSMYMITVDEGWRQSIMCGELYRWAAEWLVEEVLKDRPPYAKGRRP